MKFKINKAEFDALEPNLQALYAEVGDSYQMTVDGLPDSSEELERLKRHNEVLIGENRKRDEAVRAVEAERTRLEAEKAKETGNVEALEKSYSEIIASKDKQIQEILERQYADIVENTAQKLASNLSSIGSHQRILKRFFADRLKVVDGEVKVLDSQGKLPIGEYNAISQEQLLTEFKTSGEYDSLITGTQASGTGGSGTNGHTAKTADEYTEKERIDLAINNPAEFKRIFKKDK